MAFDDGDAYGRFMGRFSVPLAPVFLDFAGLPAESRRVLDVGCGPGVLTEELVRRLGPDQVAAVDPSWPSSKRLANDCPASTFVSAAPRTSTSPRVNSTP